MQHAAARAQMSAADVHQAAERIAGLVHRTPVLSSQWLNELAGAELFFKSEHLQKVGAFKARGAVNAVFSLGESQLKQGVATHSSGNHGAALARAASLRKMPAYIVVPANAKQVKKDAIAAYGAEVIECAPSLAARESTLESVVERTGASIIHPYNDACVIAGQGTAALELVSDVADLECIVTPVGGGGLLAGTCLIADGLEIFGAEPAGAADAERSLVTGNLVRTHIPDTICDGLLTTVGERNFEILRQKVSAVLVVDDADTVAAMSLIWTRMKQVVEPSSAIVLAAVLGNPDRFSGKRVGLVLTGGNVDLGDLPF